MRRTLLVIALVTVPTAAFAQLSDLQPGRNFTTAVTAFGANNTEDLEMGDVDNDGDLDVLVANGGNAGAQPNRIYINNGGVQGGTAGTFSEETSTRFAGVPNDTSRDIELVDIDDDGDLDVYVANRGTPIAGQVSRLYMNQGGLQGGATGFYVEETDTFWGTLVSVPLAREVGVQDGQGPWEDWACDCDFADLDDDGDSDLFHSTYGPSLNGSEPSRIFLNDGTGRFDELWPWADASADIATHSLDVDLGDFDGDFDIDVAVSSRESQARIYRNNFAANGWVGDAFTDTTQASLLDTGAGQVGSNNYGTEYVDADGDGDFDLWMTSYSGFANPILRNNGDATFTKMSIWTKADTASDDNEADFLDYDGDGDIDAFVSGFSPGTNHIYTSSLAQGIGGADGYYHRNGTTLGGSLAAWNEVPAIGNSGTTLDGGAADMDGDGDPDILLGNDSGQPNRYWENALGVPDTHAPGFAAITVQGDKSDGSDTIVHAAVRDNADFASVNRSSARLVYSVGGGGETCVRMTASGGQVFRGVIPAAVNGAVAYRVEVTDEHGNTGVSATTNYVQTSSSTSDWQALGCGTEGVSGVPILEGRGALDPLATIEISLRNAAPDAAAILFLSAASTPASFKGGTLYTVPVGLEIGSTVDDGGLELLQLVIPPGVPSGLSFWWQYVIADASAVGGVAISNAAVSTTP
jgi:hypothetical protein